MSNSSWEDYYHVQLVEAKLPLPVKEYKFLKNRKFRFDFAWPEVKLAVEIDGNVYQTSRHTSGTGYTRDCEKFALAAIEGYRVVRATTGQVSSGQLIEWTKEYFNRQVTNNE